MIVSRYGAAGAPAVGPPHFLPFFAEARRLLGLRVLGADAGLFALAGLFAARFGVAAAAGFGEAFGDAFALAAGAAFLPFDFGSFWPMTTITCVYERWGRGSARGGTETRRARGATGTRRDRARRRRTGSAARAFAFVSRSRARCAFVRLVAQRGVLRGGRARGAVLERAGAPRSGQQPEPAASRTTRSYQAAVHKGSGHVRRVKRQLRARARRWGHARAPWSPAESAPRRTP